MYLPSLPLRHWIQAVAAAARSGCCSRLIPGVFLVAVVFVTRVQAQPAPTNDDFSAAVLLTGTNVVVTGSNINATKEPGEPDHAGNSGGKSIWWDWQSPQSGYVTISTAGSTSIYGGPLDTVLGVYVGTSVSNLTTIASNDDGLIDATSLVTFYATAGTIYRIAVDGFTHDVPEDADSGSVNLSINFSYSLPLASPWDLPGLDGNTISSTNFAGKVVVLNFWATWCIPCQGEIPDLVALEQKYAPDGLVVVGMSVDDSTNGVDPPSALVYNYATNHDINYPIVMTRPNNLAVENTYNVPETPKTFIIDRQNRIAQVFVEEEVFQTFQAAVLPLLYPNLTTQLTITNQHARISWPAVQATFLVETNGRIGGTNWAAVNATVQTQGTNHFVDLPLTSASRFFRIRSQ